MVSSFLFFLPLYLLIIFVAFMVWSTCWRGSRFKSWRPHFYFLAFIFFNNFCCLYIFRHQIDVVDLPVGYAVLGCFCCMLVCVRPRVCQPLLVCDLNERQRIDLRLISIGAMDLFSFYCSCQLLIKYI